MATLATGAYLAPKEGMVARVAIGGVSSPDALGIRDLREPVPLLSAGPEVPTMLAPAGKSRHRVPSPAASPGSVTALAAKPGPVAEPGLSPGPVATSAVTPAATALKEEAVSRWNNRRGAFSERQPMAI